MNELKDAVIKLHSMGYSGRTIIRMVKDILGTCAKGKSEWEW